LSELDGLDKSDQVNALVMRWRQILRMVETALKR
jgi:hypothetical protein